jgi:hypothetical protein
MWAGIWIDGDIETVADYLHDIAEAAPAATPPPAPDTSRAAPHRKAPPMAPIRPTAGGKASGPALVAARSSGHCEIMAPGCALTWDGVASRLAGQPECTSRDPAACYAVCRSCRAALAIMEDRLKRRLGYVIDPGQEPAEVPLYWRRCRWMIFDSSGGAELAVA